MAVSLLKAFKHKAQSDVTDEFRHVLKPFRCGQRRISWGMAQSRLMTSHEGA